MPGEIKLFAYQSIDRPFENQWVIRGAGDLGKGVLAHDKCLPTALRRAANNLTKLKVI